MNHKQNDNVLKELKAEMLLNKTWKHKINCIQHVNWLSVCVAAHVQAMKANGEKKRHIYIYIYGHLFWIFVEGAGGGTASCPHCCTPPATPWMWWGWMGPRASLDILKKRKISCPCQESNLRPSSPWLSYYSDWAIPRKTSKTTKTLKLHRSRNHKKPFKGQLYE
jgi:hypothetical protein